MIFKGTNDEYLEVIEEHQIAENKEFITNNEGLLSTFWFLEDDNIIEVDGREYTLNANQLVCVTSLHKIIFKKTHKFHLLNFNSPFYCILDHDVEIGCKGLLFFGSKNLPIINAKEEDLKIFRSVWEMLVIEMKTSDNLQLEMLQMMLKRWLIICTRIFKKDENYNKVDSNFVNIVREFNFQVEQHFKTKHTVSEYASILNKSPKTISNLFKKLHNRTPLQMIQNRVMVEAKRHLKYTEMSVSEVADDLGFKDIQSFSRFFKKQEGTSPTLFKNN